MASFESAPAEYKAGMWVCANFHGIIHKNRVVSDITERLRIQSSSNMDDYGFHPSTAVLDLIVTNINNGSQSIIDELKRTIRIVENSEFEELINKEQFTCTTSDAITFFINLYSNKNNKYIIEGFEYHCSDIIRQLIGANVINTPETKQQITDCVRKIYEEMIKNIQTLQHEINILLNPSNTRIRERSRSPNGRSNTELEREPANETRSRNREPRILDYDIIRSLDDTHDEAKKEFIRYLYLNIRDLIEKFKKNNKKYYNENINQETSETSETPKRHLTYDGAAGLPYWNFEGKHEGEPDNYRGLMIGAYDGSHLDSFFKSNGFNPHTKEECILRDGNRMHALLTQLGNTCFYIPGVAGYVKDDIVYDETITKTYNYDKFLKEMSRNYDENPSKIKGNPSKIKGNPSKIKGKPYQTDMLSVCGFINFVRFLATRYHQTLNGESWINFSQFLGDKTSMNAYIYVFSCSKIERSMCEFNSNDLRRILSTSTKGGSKTRRKKPNQKSRKRRNSLILKMKRKPRK